MRPRIRTRSIGAILLGALMTAALLIGPAAAVASGPAGSRATDATTDVVGTAVRRPDGRIRLQEYRSDFGTDTYTNPWTGNNIYNTTATNQKVKAIWYATTVSQTERWTFGISIQNDGTSDRFRVTAAGTTPNGWTVRYFRGSTNITSAVVAGTFRTPLLGAGAKYLITARVTRSSPFDGGDTVRLVTMTSVGDASKKDAVKLVVKEGACGC